MSTTTYPRPDFQRHGLNWKSLDGTWDFIFDDADAGLSEQWHQKSVPTGTAKRTIQVPYAFQTPASGIGVHEAHEVMWYERTISDIRSADEIAKGNRLFVRFGAVDYDCSIWVDGQFVGGHEGGHVPFDVDVTDALGGSGKTARLTLRVRDSPYDLTQPRGKQYWKPVPESIFYTPTSGIWLSVWMESVPVMRLASSSEGTVLRSNDIEHGQLHAQIAVLGRSPGAKCSVEIETSLGGVSVSKGSKEFPSQKGLVDLGLNMKVSNTGELQNKAPFNVDGCWHNGVALWQPEHPILYDVVLRLLDSSDKIVDEVHTTTGMRSLNWQTGDGTFRLNGKSYFQALCLDQGYWAETGITPPSSDALKADIVLSKEMGLNGCRKHQKVEDPRFLYWADRLGYLVWGEIANAYEFDEVYVDRFNREWTEVVKRDINHPCIVTWTPVNESWAYPSLQTSVEQRNHIRALYYLTKYVASTSSPSPSITNSAIQNPRPNAPNQRQLRLGTRANRPNNIPRLRRLRRTNRHLLKDGRRDSGPKGRPRDVHETDNIGLYPSRRGLAA